MRSPVRLAPFVVLKATHLGRNIHVVSLVHALLIIPLALRCLGLESLSADPAFGWHPRSGTLTAVACGYFLWDTLESVVHFADIGFVVHGTPNLYASVTNTDICCRTGLLLNLSTVIRMLPGHIVRNTSHTFSRNRSLHTTVRDFCYGNCEFIQVIPIFWNLMSLQEHPVPRHPLVCLSYLLTVIWLMLPGKVLG